MKALAVVIKAPLTFLGEVNGEQLNIILFDCPTFARRLAMQQYALAAIWCVFLITAIVVYIPLMYIRKADKILKILQQIESNTGARKP